MKLLPKLCLLSCCAAFALLGAKEPQWGYSGKNGPQNWGNVSKDFYACEVGKNQSPIDITKAYKVEDPSKISFHLGDDVESVIFINHTVEVKFNKKGKDGYVKIGDKTYKLDQLHFHIPAELKFDGKQYPMSMHIVEETNKGDTLVVAVQFKIGKENKVLQTLLDSLPKKGAKSNLKKLDTQALLPKKLDYYYFNGSLTTPPCTEGVAWVALKEPIEISKDQLKKFKTLIDYPNSRPTQPVGSRVIIEN